jgi:3-methyladenine DNA glycosylase AlkD
MDTGASSYQFNSVSRHGMAEAVRLKLLTRSFRRVNKPARRRTKDCKKHSPEHR